MSTLSEANPAAPHSPTVAARAVEAVKVYGKDDSEVRALDGVTIEFATAEFTAIMGPSGSGKSTLMHCCAGLDTLTSGEVWIGDRSLSSMSERELTLMAKEGIGCADGHHRRHRARGRASARPRRQQGVRDRRRVVRSARRLASRPPRLTR